ncbi:membrane protein [Longimycelium tulufanense]|uniref:Membrane protein n=1 Tax=Longimycelium tulufanense TaxID=907463 RepID=A0A8J3CBL1_9PSEU|nr:HdeD family acid-resistance protein [Longimycelium tulufanense]GGM70362.1 membrane protein [Longimycelium tulufanense]
MGALLLRAWWVPVVRGVAAILFGILAIIWPGLTLLALVLLWGFFALVDGVFGLAAAFSSRTAEPVDRWTWVLFGVVGLLAGIAALVWPDITALVLLVVIGVWAVVTGVLQIVGAFRLRRLVSNEWLLGLAGVLTVALGLLLLLQPGRGALALVTLIGLFALVWGVVLVALGLRLRALGKKFTSTSL